MNKIKALVEVKKRVYIHQDLEQAAYYFKKTVESLSKAKDRDGIGIEMMACLLFLAFEAEAKFNFLGHKLFGAKWNEHQPYLVKLEKVARHLEVPIDYNQRPHKSIKQLRDYRNTLAHGKPIEIDEPAREMEGTIDEFRKKGSLRGEWEDCLTEKFIAHCADDVDKIWKSMLERAGIKILDTMTEGGVTISFTTTN